MLIHAKVCGYHDWVPCPAGTEITAEDVKAMRVKQMTNDSWHMRVEITAETVNDCNIPELAICDRMASLVLLGRPQSREATAAEMLASTYRHHFNASKHLVEITVLDDGPNAELYAACLKQLGVPEDRIESAVADYADGGDVATYLNVMFKTKSTKNAKVTP